MVEWLLRLARAVGLRGVASRIGINRFANTTHPRPRPFSLWSTEEAAATDSDGYVSDYTSWPSLTDRGFSARHLKPADPAYSEQLPLDLPYKPASGQIGDVTALFVREGAMKTDRSSVLFPFFAQWFTDSILRFDPKDRRKNTSNHDIDLCQVYGLTEAQAGSLRTNEGGLLRSQEIRGEEYLDYLCRRDDSGRFVVKDEYQTIVTDAFLDRALAGFPDDRREKLYAAGLERGNSSIGYVAISTIFMREHNRLCRELSTRNPGWSTDDERLFQTARMINIALLLKLLVEDYINHIVGAKVFVFDPSFAEGERWYRPNWIAAEFDLLYRWHSLMPDVVKVGAESYDHIQFRNNNALLEQVGVAAVIDAASRQPAGRIGLRNTPKFLWDAEYQAIKMSRDFRLQPFNEYRQRFGLDPLRSFEELTSDAELRTRLASLYGHVDNLEYVVGIFAEDRQEAELFGSLMNRMVAYDAFTQIFTNPLIAREIYTERTFTDYGLDVIRQTDSIQTLVNRNLPAGATARASLGVLD